MFHTKTKTKKITLFLLAIIANLFRMHLIQSCAWSRIITNSRSESDSKLSSQILKISKGGYFTTCSSTTLPTWCLFFLLLKLKSEHPKPMLVVISPSPLKRGWFHHLCYRVLIKLFFNYPLISLHNIKQATVPSISLWPPCYLGLWESVGPSPVFLCPSWSRRMGIGHFFLLAIFLLIYPRMLITWLAMRVHSWVHVHPGTCCNIQVTFSEAAIQMFVSWPVQVCAAVPPEEQTFYWTSWGFSWPRPQVYQDRSGI